MLENGGLNGGLKKLNTNLKLHTNEVHTRFEAQF